MNLDKSLNLSYKYGVAMLKDQVSLTDISINVFNKTAEVYKNIFKLFTR